MNRDQNNERRERAVSALIDSESTLEGGGFPVRRPFPTARLMQADPFLLLDHLGPVKWGPGQAMERYRLMKWLNFISSEVHKTLGALFNPKLTPEWKDNQIAVFGRRCDYLVKTLGSKAYLMGDKFSIADAYLFTVLSWSAYLKVDMSKWPALKDYMARINARPAVKEAMRAEGLIK